MLTITVLGQEHFNEDTEEIFTVGDVVLELEHSLVALSKWESIYKKPFLSSDEKTQEETLGYISCMILTEDCPDDILSRLSNANIDAINAYINDSQTATWFSDTSNAPKSREIITNEIIYYWMFSAGIDLECEHWHLNRLFTLVKVFDLKNAKPKKMSPSEIRQRNRELNAQRRKELGTRG